MSSWRKVEVTYRFRGDLGVIEVEMMSLPSTQVFGAEDFTDDGAWVVGNST